MARFVRVLQWLNYQSIFIDVIMCLIKREFLVKVIVGFNG